MDVGPSKQPSTCIQELSVTTVTSTAVFNLNTVNDSIFLSCKVADEEGKLRAFYVLPDSGNRARCLLRYDIFRKLHPNAKLIPVEDKITTAKKGDYLEIMGQSEISVRLYFAKEQYLYTCRPFIVKKLQLPCLLSAHDMRQMQMIVDHRRHTVLLGKNQIPDKLIPCPEEVKVPVNMMYNETIEPFEEAIVAVKIGIKDNSTVNLLIQPSDEFRTKHEVHCLETLDHAKNNGISHITIVNFTDHPVTLKAGTEIGIACQVNTIERIPEKSTKEEKKMSAKELRNKLEKDFKLQENNYLSEEQKLQMLELLCKNEDVISKGSADIGRCEEVECRIETEEGKTVKSQLRPLPPHLKENFKTQLDAWLDKGIVEKTTSACPYSSPLVPVKKKNGNIRWAVDFRRLNNISKKDHRPIPNVFERLSSLKATSRKPLRYYGCLDLQDAFHNIPIAEDSRDKTAVITPFGLYRFLRMPFGLHIAPQVFAELVGKLEDKLKELSKKSDQILIYFDDCLICGSTFEEFMELLELFLNVLRTMNLKINPGKCQLGLSSTKWLGHEISDEGIKPAQELTNTVKDWPTPRSVTELRAFFGTISYYRRFIPRFAERTNQMRKLLQKNTPFIWTEKQETEMKDLKEALCTKPILGHPDFTKDANPFILYVDSSKTGVGAVISQEQTLEYNNKTQEAEVVIAYGSRTLTTGEQHYSAYKKELLGMVYAIHHFKYYLYGRKFIVRTDHRALEWLLKTRTQNAPSLLYRWQDVLSEYDFQIEYVPGTKMGHVDGISRKGNQEDNKGNIKDLPDMDQALQTMEDEFWLTKFKTKEVNMLDRPKRNLKPSSRFNPSEYVDLPQHFYNPPPFQNELLNTPPATPLEIELNTDDERLLDEPDDFELDYEEVNWEMESPDIQETAPTINQNEPRPSTSTNQDEPRPSPRTVGTPPTQENPTSEINPDELIAMAQKKDPALKLIQNRLLPMKGNGHEINKDTFSRYFKRDDVEDWRSYWKVWTDLELDKDRNILILKSPLQPHEGQGEKVKIILPKELRAKALLLAHDDPSVLHPGIKKTSLILEDRFWWPQMKKDIEEYVQHCVTCQRKNRGPEQNIKIMGNTTSQECPPLSKWSIDIVSFTKAHGPQGFSKILTMMDYTSRWVEAYPIKDEQAPTLIKAIRKNFVPRFGLGAHFVSDNGSSFISKQFEQMAKDLGGFTTSVIPYHAQANPVERAHREFNQKLRILLEEKPESHWIDYMEHVLLAYRTTPSSVTEMSPYFLLYGTQPTLAVDIIWKSKPKVRKQKEVPPTPLIQPTVQIINHVKKSTLDRKALPTYNTNIRSNSMRARQDARQLALERIQKRHNQNAQQAAKKCKKPIIFNKNDLVDLWRPYDINNPMSSRRFARYWSGPYKVINHQADKPHRVIIGPTQAPYWKKSVFVNHLRKRGRTPEQVLKKLPPGFHPCRPPFTSRLSFTGDELQKIYKEEIQITKQVQPTVMEEINKPKPGALIGLTIMKDQDLTKFNKFYKWHQDRDSRIQNHQESNNNKEEDEDDNDDDDIYYVPDVNEPIEYLAETFDPNNSEEHMETTEKQENQIAQSTKRTFQETLTSPPPNPTSKKLKKD